MKFAAPMEKAGDEMAIVPMSKLTIAAMKTEREEILKALQKAGIVQLSQMEHQDLEPGLAGVSLHEAEEQIARTSEVLAVLSNYGEARQQKSGGAIDRDLMKQEERILSLHQKRESLIAKKQDLQEKECLLLPFRAYPLPLEAERMAYVSFLLGKIPNTVSIGILKDSLWDFSAELFVLDEDEAFAYLCLLCYGKEEATLCNILSEAEFLPLDRSDFCGTAQKNIGRLREEIQSLSIDIKKLSKQLKKEADALCDFQNLLNFYENQKERLLAREKLAETESVFFLSGWIPKEKEREISRLFEKKFPLSELVFSPPEEKEEIPVLLENNSFVRPFELVTELYSMPAPFEVDPNPVMSIFYVVFFGMMLSDAGYGIVLALATGIYLKVKQPKKTTEKLIKLIFLGGISAIFWGILFGGWFGDLLSFVPLFRPRWFNPLEDPMTLLLWSFVFGGVHIVVGMAVKAYLLIREGKWLSALYDIGLWYVVFGGLLLWFFAGTLWLFVLGLAGLVLTQGRAEKKPFKKLSKGLLSLYDITGFLSDILSYSRLLALGLATGVIGQVVNTMASLGGDGIFGKILFVLVLLVGHTFNIAINTLGAYVHASRLQYVEFYGKFYSGGGKPFVPFGLRGTQ